jgi:hypothetical protein
VREHLGAVPQEAPVGPGDGAVDAPAADVRLAGVAGIRWQLKRHNVECRLDC